MNQNPEIQKQLLSWFSREKRDLPWRKTTDPYPVWISEVMLQQTQVSRVMEYYGKFLKRFPDIHALAKTTWKEFLPHFRGLGYYSRGRNMLKTANLIVKKFDGEFPSDAESLRSLPGIGEYTAAAIMSFSWNKPFPAVDTNVSRIMQRVIGCPKNQVKKRTESIFGNTKKSRDLNYALMDLGAMICRSKKVQCEICPLRSVCHFLKSGTKEQWEGSLGKKDITIPANVKRKPVIEVAAACIHCNRKYLIAKRKESKGGFWEFPGGKRERGEDWRGTLKREIREELGIEISVRPHFFEEMWEDGEFFWRLRFFRCQILSGKPKCLDHARLGWVSPKNLNDYDFPSANAKAVEKLREMKFPE